MRLGEEKMRIAPCAVAAGVMLLAVPLVGLAEEPIEVLWDNYLSPEGFDGVGYFSSERNVTVTDGWAADDFVLTTGAHIARVEWLGIRRPGYAYTADVLLLSSAFEPRYALAGVAYQWSAVNGGRPLFGLDAYAGAVNLPAVALPPGHYYVAARLASPGQGGRNLVLTTGAGVPNPAGFTMGAVYNADFGVNKWTLIHDCWGSPVTDYAYRVYGRRFSDCNANGVPDSEDIAGGAVHDDNHDGVPDECQLRPGDTNCDGAVNFDDIEPFVLALQGAEAYGASFPTCFWHSADCNIDGAVNFDDVDAFVAALEP